MDYNIRDSKHNIHTATVMNIRMDGCVKPPTLTFDPLVIVPFLPTTVPSVSLTFDPLVSVPSLPHHTVTSVSRTFDPLVIVPSIYQHTVSRVSLTFEPLVTGISLPTKLSRVCLSPLTH